MSISVLDNPILAPVFIVDAARDAHDQHAWMDHILRTETALASTQAKLGIIPNEAALAIASLRPDQFDNDQLAARTLSLIHI